MIPLTLSPRFSGTSSMNLTKLFTSFDMPSCLRRCMPALDNIGALFDAAKNPETMKAMCRDMTEASKCATAAGCDKIFIGAISNAFQFVCMDNLEKVSSQIACIQENAGDLQQECESECAVQADVLDNAVKNTANQLFNMEKICNSTTCIANCYQDNIHKFCDIGEDNLLDTIFSQFEALQEQPGILGYVKKVENNNKTGISKLFGLMLPDGCNDKKMQFKIPKKISLDKPKSVGSPSNAHNEIPSQKNSPKSAVKNETDTEDALMAKSGNLSTAAVMFKNKVHTLQCQFLDSHGNPQNTPDFETLSKILSEHFDKKELTTTSKPDAKIPESKTRACREAESNDPQSRNSGATAIISTVSCLVALNMF
ncbi:Chondroitin proteoglycan 4 domain-containing protein [Caenorhabditis elegans]|uniref:Chondroitin proteoglycan 4 domain-containing protein n=1 Tax=Caenorhabditis elegans TaxID=6239 RepID=A0ACB0DP98_CAEEL|nr:Chondroitin proteoglycan 4 domain-containing protein [Caenorhabditis elegans]CAI9648310.1 Chondroitin proteoglycan 4 domain-containing protein [Caenorhabditis elegans]